MLGDLGIDYFYPRLVPVIAGSYCQEAYINQLWFETINAVPLSEWLTHLFSHPDVRFIRLLTGELCQ